MLNQLPLGSFGVMLSHKYFTFQSLYEANCGIEQTVQSKDRDKSIFDKGNLGACSSKKILKSWCLETPFLAIPDDNFCEKCLVHLSLFCTCFLITKYYSTERQSIVIPQIEIYSPRRGSKNRILLTYFLSTASDILNWVSKRYLLY